MRTPHKSRVIVPHNKDCFMKDREVPWSGIPTGTFWGNFAANKNTRNGHYLWIKVSCNDPKCKAIKAVDTTVLAFAE